MMKKEYNHSFKMTETIILKELDHPNILKLFAIYEDQHCYYLVTEYFLFNEVIYKEGIS